MSYTTTMNIIIRSLPLQTDGNCAVQHKTNRVLRGLFCFLLFMGAMSAKAQITLIPDANFEQALIEQEIDTDGVVNGQVFTADIENVTYLDVTNLGIVDMTGIEDFIRLEVLLCNNNELTQLNLSNSPNLYRLDCQQNQLTSLDIFNSSDLKYLFCQDNLLPTLDLSQNPILGTQFGENQTYGAGWMDATNNPNMVCIKVINKEKANLGLEIHINWQKETETMYSENCGSIDYFALMDLYDATGGENWTNNTNWLTEEPLENWYGVTTINGKVVALNLSDNNLVGEIPEGINALDELTDLVIDGNEITSLPDMSSLTNLSLANVVGNELHFSHLLPNMEIPNFSYAPQDSVGKYDKIYRESNAHYGELGCFTASIFGQNNQYQWSYNGQDLTDGLNNDFGFWYEHNPNWGLVLISENGEDYEYTVSAATGHYVLRATNPNVPGLTLYHRANDLVVLHGLEMDRTVLEALYIALDGDNWVNNTNWLTDAPLEEWHGITVQDGRVSEVDLVNNNLNGQLPNEIGSLQLLANLYLQNNQIYGTIPEGIDEFQGLLRMDMSHNQLTSVTGNFNDTGGIDEGCVLEYLNLSHNLLTKFPPTYINGNENIASVENVDLSHNRLVDIGIVAGMYNDVNSVNLHNNRLDFGDLKEAELDHSYAPQENVDTELYIAAETGQIIDLFTTATAVHNSNNTPNQYKWFFNGEELLTTDEGHIQFVMTPEDHGTYDLEITNALLPELTLYREPIDVRYASDSLALVQTYIKMNGENWSVNTNWLEGPMNTWHGVTADKGRVKELVLPGNNLTGEFPEDLGVLTALTHLDFSNNDVTGINTTLNTLLTTFNATNNSNLYCIQVADEAAANNKQGQYLFWQKDNQASYSEDCSENQQGDLTIQAENLPDDLAINVQYKVKVTVPEDEYDENVEATIGIYLSVDGQYDVGDQLLISGPIMTNTPTDFIFVIEEALLSGNYHLIFRADIDDAYDETNETNNQQVFARYLNAKSNIDETCFNYISTYTYGQDNTQIGSARSYFDFSGKPIQTQGKSFATGLITVSEPLYDRFGRGVGQTMGAPMNINEHVYYPNFMVNEEGDKYDYTDFDENNVLSPNAVGSQNGTLGGYYSENNVLEPYTPITSYPYSRTEFYGDGSGEARRSAGAGDEMHMGSGKETLGGTFPITDELDHYKSIRDLFFPDNTNYSYNKRGYQTVVEDVNDRFHISCFDKTGNLLMSAMEGDWMALQMYVSYFENPQRYFYLIEDQDVSVNFWNNSTLQNIVTNEIIAIDQSGDLALTKGYYRFFADAIDLGSGQITLENSLGDISYNIYDDADRLIASIAPNGVKELIDNNVEDYKWDELPFTTYYTYNHQGWLLETSEPDAGRSEFIYRKDGSIRYSQNALQRTSGHFSYTEYDKLGRPIESGEYPDAGWDFGGDNMIENLEAVGNVSKMWEDNRKDWVRTHYDFADPELSGKPFNDGTYGQDFMQGGVSWTENDKVKTWYSYDELGRTAWTAQEQSTYASEKIKYLAVHYTYDYPGNVTKTGFEVFDDEGNLQDEGYHYYTYDADQRLHQAYFSTWDNITDLENDPHALLQATYTYYLHGPLKRVELGEDIQGIDYTYTLSGQLKSINHPHQANDPGKDDNDVFGMLLEYYENDYLSRAQPENYRNDDEGLVAQYNGNIAAMSWRSNDVFGMANSAAKGTYVYDYDNKSQLLQAQLATPTFTGANYAYAFANDNPGKVVIQGYDPNGNITGLVRNGQGGPVEHDFTYNYIAGTNQLQNIPDHVGLYEYDEIGQLVHEQGESGSEKNMRYDVTGKVNSVYDENNQSLAEYEYDERGFRIRKQSEILDNTTWYMRDVSGNILMTYTKEGFNDPEPYEIPLYGAGRVGTYYANDFGATDYEVSDHLGNVRALVKNDKNGYLATMEPANKNTEDNLFNNYLASKEPLTGANHTAGEGAAYISLLNEAQRVGPVKVLQVNPGDKVAMETYVKYLALEGAMSDGGTIGNLFDQVSTAFGALNGGTEDEQTIYDLFNTNFAGTLAVSPGNGDFDDEPRAYLNYLFFSENGTFIPENSGYTGMTSNAKIPWIDGIPEAGEIPHEKLAQTLDIEQPGYLYIYIANESNEAGVEVYFDDLMVMHNTTMLAQTTDYYPFGSELRTAKTNVDKQYRFGYQGQFAEKDEETGWNHFELRNFDPVVGRWMSTDPYGQYWSPYIGMGNNPVNLVDPDGGCADCPPKLKSLGFEPLVGADPNFGDMLYNNGLMPTRRLYPITIISPAGDKEKFLFRQKIYKAQGEFLAGSRPYIIMGAHILAGPGGWASYGKSLAFGYIKSGGDLQGSVEGVDAMGLLFGQIKSSGLKNLLNNFIDYNGKEGFGVKSFSLVEGEGGNITLQVDSGELYYNILKSGVHTGIDKLTKTQMEYLGPAPKYTNDIFKRMFGSEGFPE